MWNSILRTEGSMANFYPREMGPSASQAKKAGKLICKDCVAIASAETNVEGGL